MIKLKIDLKNNQYEFIIKWRDGIWLFCFCMWFGLSIGQKQMCQISDRGLIGGCQGVVYRTGVQFINNNGPAIWGGCVTRRIPAGRQYPGIGVQSF
jgi:hypothetical protein